jgi:hypothetical protein
MKQTTMGERLTKWKIFLQSYDYTIIHTAWKNNVFANTLLQIYEKRTPDTEAEIMEDTTINKSFSTLTFLPLSSVPDQYSHLSYPYFTTSIATSSFIVLSSNPDYYHYQ